MSYRSDNFDLYGASLEEEEADEGGYLGRHWRGRLSLGRTYWVNGVLANIVVAVLGLLLLTLEQSGQSLRIISVGFVLYFALFLVIRGWAMVGIWRSAGLHKARGGVPAWGYIARAVVAIGVIGSALQLPNVGLQAKEYGLIAIGRDPLGPMAKLTLDPKREVIEVKGSISAGLADAFAAMVETAPGLRLVSVDSDGGRITEALRMAEVMKKRGLDARVEQRCASACTFLLLAGKERSAHQFAEIGFHQPDFPGVTAADRKQFIADNRADYIKAGITPDFLDRALETPPEEMWFPNHDELMAAGVLTAREFTVGSQTGDQQRLADILKRNAVEANQVRGQMIDESTRFLSASASGTELRFNYQLTEAIPRSRRAAAASDIRESVRDAICSEIQGQMIARGARFAYHYVGPGDEEMFDFSIDKCPAEAG